MRILGLDYGSKRIGVAVCDELGLTAQGLTTITRKNIQQDIGAIGHIIQEYEVEKIVVGFPVMLDGSQGIQCEKVDRFIQLLESAFSLPVVRWDETLSTREAERVLMEAELSRKKRKKVIDKLAAVIILQGYLDYSSITRPFQHDEKNSL